MSLENQNLHTGTQEAINTPPEAEGGLLTINGTLPVIIVSFILFAFIMQKIFYGPLTAIRKRRSDYINKVKTEANEILQSATDLEEDYKNKLNTAHRKVSARTTEALTEANEEKTKILSEKKQEVSQYVETQNKTIKKEQTEAIEDLKENIMQYAFDISSKILGEEIPITGISPDVIEKALNR